RDVRDGDRLVAPQGALVRGEVIQVEQSTGSIYEIGIEFHAMDLSGREVIFTATMEDAGPANGLIRQSKRLEPTFSRRGPARMDVLVRRVQRGHGYLHWDGRHGALPRGLKMKWKVLGEAF